MAIKPKYITRLGEVFPLNGLAESLAPVVDEYAFRTNDYYNSLIDWNDPNDPIRKIVIPDSRELETWGALDPSNEQLYTKTAGLQHKYQSTALLLVTDVCGAYCRFCFRKRLFMDSADEVTRDVSDGIAYIENHPEISNVLLTGGDPLVMSTPKLEKIIASLRQIEHVKIIRLGSKMTAFNPYRIINDPSLLEMFKRHSHADRRIYMMAHFNHPRELTEQSRQALKLLQEAGVILVNQTPLLRGVNDDADTLVELFAELSYIGVPPYYLFQCRPTAGNKLYSVPIETGYEIFEAARARCSGLAKRARFVMSHANGKIEVAGLDETRIYFKFHRPANPEDNGRFLSFERNAEACWYDDYLGEYEHPESTAQLSLSISAPE